MRPLNTRTSLDEPKDKRVGSLKRDHWYCNKLKGDHEFQLSPVSWLKPERIKEIGLEKAYEEYENDKRYTPSFLRIFSMREYACSECGKKKLFKKNDKRLK